MFDALKPAGIEGSYQAARDTGTGVIAPVLSFTALLPAPPENPLVGGSTKVTLDIGHAIAQIAAQVISDTAPALAPPAGVVGAAGSGVDAAGVPAALPSTALPTTGLPAGAVPGVAPTALIPGTGILPAVAFDDLRRGGVGNIFLALAGACLVGVLVTGLVLRGVRS